MPHLNLVVLEADLPLALKVREQNLNGTESRESEQSSSWHSLKQAWNSFWRLKKGVATPKVGRLPSAIQKDKDVTSFRVTIRDKDIVFWPGDLNGPIDRVPRKMDCSVFSSDGTHLLNLKGAFWTQVEKNAYTVAYDHVVKVKEDEK